VCLRFVAAVFALIACGGHSRDDGSGSGQPSAHALRVQVSGDGKVTSAPAGIDCGANCSASFSQAVTLTAAPSAGATFAGWGGACSGTADCHVAMSGDADVTATFTQLPGNAVLSIAVDGTGLVTSPDGIHCSDKCEVSLPVGTQVSLTAMAGTGMSFAGWSGACNGLLPCSFQLTGNTSVGARFISGPPPPQDECDGLAPASLPDPVVATMPQGGCLGGTSDDGTGNYALGYSAGMGPTFPNYFFFTIQNGEAVRVGGTIPGGDESGTYVYSQPSGFTSFHVSGVSGGSSILTWTHEGKNASTAPVVDRGLGPVSEYPSSAVGIDPSGGTVAVRTYKDPARDWVTELQRFDKSGQVESPWVTIDTGKHFGSGVGVALSGHALVLQAMGALPPGNWRGRWFARDGTPITGWFSFTADSNPYLHFLMDGSVVARYRNSGHLALGAGWQFQFEDGKEGAAPPPDWLGQRYAGQFAVIRNGRGYASWNAGKCGGADAVEVLAASSGKSCGCLAVPDPVKGSVSVGRDGSLIVAHQANGPCQYKLYPQLLK
jgi:hypothetical protein